MATATPAVKNSILQLLRNPFITTESINRSNIQLSCEEILSDDDFSFFASRAAEIIASDCAVIYVDFINNIGPIASQLHALGIETVAYHGEMDVKSRDASYTKWKTEDNGSSNGIWYGNRQRGYQACCMLWSPRKSL